MHPGDDPALARRFLGWLQARHADAPGLGTAFLRLGELKAWELPPEELAAMPFGADERPALLHLHALWREFAGDLPAEWVELAGRPDDVAWVSADADMGRLAPSGPAPVLLRGEGAARPPRRRPRPLAGALIAAAALLAVLVPLAHSLRAARRQRAEVLDTRRAVAGTPRSLVTLRERLARQELTAQLLLKARALQRAAVNASCEGEPECVRRLAALDASARLAQAVLAAAREDADHPAIPPPGPVVPAPAPAILQRERDDLASIAAPTPSQAAELAALDVALASGAAP